MKKLTLALSVAALSFVTACDKSDKSSELIEGAPTSRTEYAQGSQASLLETLPSKTVAYLRVPNVAGLFSIPQADALYPALANQTVQTQGKSILQGIDKNLLSKVDDATMRELLGLFVNKQKAPIELAVLAGVGGVMTPEVFLHTKLDLTDMAELKDLLDQIVIASQSQLQLVKGPDADGNFRLAVGPINAAGYFDLNSKDFVVYGGPAAIVSNLTKYRAGTLETRSDLKDFEKQFDASGAGLSFWADTDTLWQQLSPMAPPEIRPQLEQFNLQDSKFAYFGTGAKGGHGSMRLHLQYKEGGNNLLYFPASKSAWDVPVAPPVDFTATFPMPNQKHLATVVKLEEKFGNRSGDSQSLAEAIADATELLKNEYQLDLNQLLSAFESSALVVGDKSGMWTSLAIQDAEGFNSLLATTQEKFGATLSKTTIEGAEITHYVFPGLTKLALQMAPEGEVEQDIPEPLMQLLSGENMHLYWVREGNNLIIASLPQVLIARGRHKSSATALDWMQSRNMMRSESTFSVAANAQGLPKQAYHMYLKAVQSLSDIAGVKPNLTAMPLAEDLGLAEDGRVGVALNTGKYSTSLVLDYEQSPLDYLAMGGNAMATVAVVGILAAVAIPAYQDYEVRANGTQALVSAARLKTALSEYYLSNGKFPNAEDAEPFSIRDDVAIVYFDAEEAVIKIVYSSGVDERLSDTELNLTPEISEGGYVEWTCNNISAPEALIPSSCRN